MSLTSPTNTKLSDNIDNFYEQGVITLEDYQQAVVNLRNKAKERIKILKKIRDNLDYVADNDKWHHITCKINLYKGLLEQYNTILTTYDKNQL